MRKQNLTETDVLETPNNNVQTTVGSTRIRNQTLNDECPIPNMSEPNFVSPRPTDVAPFESSNFVSDPDQMDQINPPNVHDRNEERIDQPQHDEDERFVLDQICLMIYPDPAERARLSTPIRPASPVDPLPPPMRNQIQTRDRSPPDDFHGRYPEIRKRNRNPIVNQLNVPAGEQERQPPQIQFTLEDIIEVPPPDIDIQLPDINENVTAKQPPDDAPLHQPEDIPLPDIEPAPNRMSFLLVAIYSK